MAILRKFAPKFEQVYFIHSARRSNHHSSLITDRVRLTGRALVGWGALTRADIFVFRLSASLSFRLQGKPAGGAVQGLPGPFPGAHPPAYPLTHPHTHPSPRSCSMPAAVCSMICVHIRPPLTVPLLPLPQVLLKTTSGKFQLVHTQARSLPLAALPLQPARWSCAASPRVPPPLSVSSSAPPQLLRALTFE